jgi:hypothetical protein
MKDSAVEASEHPSREYLGRGPGLQTFFEVAERLDANRIPWCIFGGLAVRLWGVPRAVADIDVVLKCELAQCAALFPRAKPVAANGLGWDQVELWCEPMCLPSGNGRVFIEFDREMQNRRARMRLGSELVWVQSLEDVVVSKAILQRGGTKSDLEDLRQMLCTHAERLDLDYLRHRARQAMAEARVFECLHGLNGPWS